MFAEVRDALGLLLDVPDNAETHEAALEALVLVDRLEYRYVHFRNERDKALRKTEERKAS